jgi:hypothetical protein
MGSLVVSIAQWKACESVVRIDIGDGKRAELADADPETIERVRRMIEGQELGRACSSWPHPDPCRGAAVLAARRERARSRDAAPMRDRIRLRPPQ